MFNVYQIGTSDSKYTSLLFPKTKILLNNLYLKRILRKKSLSNPEEKLYDLNMR